MATPAARPRLSFVSRIFDWPLVPWWVTFFLSIYVLFKIGLVLESPCAVLGLPSPVTKSSAKQAWRKLALCTHSDKLNPTSFSRESIIRGDILFQKASKARTEIFDHMKATKQKKFQCYPGELENAIYQVAQELFQMLQESGITGFGTYMYHFVYSLLTFESGFFGTISMLMLCSFTYRMVATLYKYLRDMGPVQTITSAISAVILGPFPTIFRLFATPLVRIHVFLTQEVGWCRGGKGKKKKSEEDMDENKLTDGDGVGRPQPTTAHVVVTSGDNESIKPAGLRKRGKRDHPDVLTQNMPLRNKTNYEIDENEVPSDEAIAGAGAVGDADEDQAIREGREQLQQRQQRAMQANQPKIAPFLDPSVDLRGTVGRIGWDITGKALYSKHDCWTMRKEAADQIQFNYLLTLTKPIIPLCMLLSTGQVFNGLLPSMATGYILRNWVPKFRAESLHIGCVIFGFLHTILGLNEAQIEASAANSDVLQLQWSWSFRDVLSIVNLVQLGASFSSWAGLGNEPLFTVSFAAGVALRMALYDITPVRMGKYLNNVLKDMKVAMSNADELVVRSGGGVGECGGGVFRSLFGEAKQGNRADNTMAVTSGMAWGTSSSPEIAAAIFRIFLLILPLLTAMQWVYRSIKARQKMIKESAREKPRPKLLALRRKRMVSTALMALVVCFLVAFIVRFNMNSLNGTMSNFWLAVLVGCILESHLSTYDVRGNANSVIFVLVFIFL